MSSSAHGAYVLRCRVCEEVSEPEARDSCRRCDGPTDVAYDWPQIRREVSHTGIAAGPPSLWRYEALLPTAAVAGVPAGWTPLERVDVAFRAARGRPAAQARGRQPDTLVQGSDRDDRGRRRDRARPDDGLLLVDRQSRRRSFRGSCGDRARGDRAGARQESAPERLQLGTPERGSSRSPARTTTAAGSNWSSARSSRGDSSAATSTRTRARARRRSRSRSRSNSDGSCPTRSSAPLPAGCCSRSSRRDSPN